MKLLIKQTFELTICIASIASSVCNLNIDLSLALNMASNSEEVVTVDVHAAKDLLDSAGFRYLDVRTNEEFSKSHVENAVNVAYMFITPQGKVKNPEFLDQISAVCSKDDQLVVGCNSGGRSVRACADLLKDGYKNVKNMGGGYSAWVDNGLAGDSTIPAEEMKTACKFRH